MPPANKELPSVSNTTVCCQTDETCANKKQDDDKSSVITIVCRICYDGEKDEPIITPCSCKGTVAYVHRSCLETWLAESNTTTCELCHYVYRTERTPKYTVRQSLWQWIRRETPNLGFEVRGIRTDFLACALLTPLAVAITYICLFSADYYNQQRFSHVPAARWTSVSLLIMVTIMLIGYYLWAYMAIKYHSRVWYYWWQRECVVRLPSEELNRSSTSPQQNIPMQNSNDDAADTRACGSNVLDDTNSESNYQGNEVVECSCSNQADNVEHVQMRIDHSSSPRNLPTSGSNEVNDTLSNPDDEASLEFNRNGSEVFDGLSGGSQSIATCDNQKEVNVTFQIVNEIMPKSLHRI